MDEFILTTDFLLHPHSRNHDALNWDAHKRNASVDVKAKGHVLTCLNMTQHDEYN